MIKRIHTIVKDSDLILRFNIHNDVLPGELSIIIFSDKDKAILTDKTGPRLPVKDAAV